MRVFKIGQISAEYLMVISFVLFIVLSVLGLALAYSSQIKDTLKMNQIESFSDKVISSAETVFYSGYPSRTVVKAYLPEGVKQIRFIDNFLVFNITSSSGDSIISFRSNVNISGEISPLSGLKVIYINATHTEVVING